MEYIDGPSNQVNLYRTLHRIVRVNDDTGIESFNRIYLGVTDNSDIIDMRARTILPSGKIIEIDKQNIKDLKEKDGRLYKIFAMEGLEKGAELEYYYTFKREASYFGREPIQNAFPVIESLLQILTPERLSFEMKGYNCPIRVEDTVSKGKKTSSVRIYDIPGVEKEKYAAYDANLERVEYKLSHNTAKGDERLFTWNELAKRIYGNYTAFTEKELKKVMELNESRGWNKLGTEREKIIAVEEYLKKNFATREDIDASNTSDIEMIIKNRIASHRGILRLYGAIFEKLGVDHQYVLTCDRSEYTIDRSFENWSNTTEFLLYFPGTKKFMAPTLAEIRYPWINPYWGDHDALFCKGTTIGNYTTAIASVRTIPLEDYTQSYNKIDSRLKLNAGLDTVLVDMKHSFGGYSAIAYRAGYSLATPEEQRVFIKEMVKFGTNSDHIVSSEVKNAGFESYPDNAPFILHAVVKANEMLENAGNKILVKIGEIIGPQTEMYQEKPRQFPMEVAYPHTLQRNIEFTIPEGYTVKNPADLTINDVFTENGEATVGFASSYTMEGNTIKIRIMEQYRKTFYPLSEYENFKKVINASADFNKIVLVLEKK
jgi:hypothetical protein